MAFLTLIINNFMFPLLVLSLLMSFFFFIIKKIHYHQKGIIVTKSYPLPPGLKPWPVFGSIFEMLKHKSTHKWIHKIMNEMKTEISYIRLGSMHFIVVTSPELGCEFFKNQDSIFATRPQSVTSNLTSDRYLSIILTPYGDQFKKMKKILTSKMTIPSKYTFYQRKISGEADHAIYYALIQCSPARPDGGRGGIVNVRSVARQYTINVMKRVVFNKRYFGKETMSNGGPGIEDEEHVDALLTVIHYIHSFSMSDLLPWMSFLDLDGHNKLVNEALKIVRKYHDPIIEDRVLMFANNEGLRKEDDEEEDEDFLDVLLKLKDDNGRPMLTVEEIKALITDLMLASTDNPSNVVEWALAEMINQPEILSKATQELDKVVGKSRLVEQSDLPKLNYIKSCIKESFRLHPISPFNVPHVSMKDTTVSGYFIPKGSQVLLSRLGIGRNPRVWNDEPMKFKPQRHFEEKRIFSSSNEEVINYVNLNDTELNLVAFSVGRRGCPAAIMGSTMVTLLLARLVQGFSWTVPPGVEKIDLAESGNSLHLGNPLLAFAKPRLATNLYPQS